MEGEAAHPLGAGDSQWNNATARAALQQSHWPFVSRLSSVLARIERFLSQAGFDRAPWLAVAFAAGISAWFVLPMPVAWLLFMAITGLAAAATLIVVRESGEFPYTRQGIAALGLMAAAGCGLIWVKSVLVGMPPIGKPFVGELTGIVVKRDEQPAQGRVRLVVATREAGTDRAILVRVNVSVDRDIGGANEGALIAVKARLMPPASPMLPGAYDFARAAWFDGLAGTGTALGPIVVLRDSEGEGGSVAAAQRAVAEHVRGRIAGSAGGIAAAFASGDRGGIAIADEEAMRDAGLTHLLSISGLHVSAVVAAAYFIAQRLFGLFPWLVLRVRLPLLAAASGALAGMGYTILTGSEVPTIRSCLGAILVLCALALGREPLSLRMLAVAAFIVMLFWPESVVGPSFQMSFGSVIAIVAFHSASPVRSFLAPREEAWWARLGRRFLVLLATGVVIELALMPIGLFHFYRAGAYGALANVIAIPLTTFISMPLVAAALVFDSIGAGGPLWWLAGLSLDLLLALAHFIARQPGAVTNLPAMGGVGFALFLAGGLWLALWQGRVRLWGLVPVFFGTVYLAVLQPPDLLISGDGAHVGITGLGERLVVLRESRSEYARSNLTESSGMAGETQALVDLPDALCSAAFCAFRLERGGRTWNLLMARNRDPVAWRDLIAACERSDIVIADRRLPQACKPRWIKADRTMLDKTGGLTIDLRKMRIRSVAQGQGSHGWWRPRTRNPWPVSAPSAAAP